MMLPHFLTFASDATLSAIAGGAMFALALTAVVGDRLRTRRRNIDAVGWVPWTGIFVFSSFAGVALFTLAIKGWAGA